MNQPNYPLTTFKLHFNHSQLESQVGFVQKIQITKNMSTICINNSNTIH